MARTSRATNQTTSNSVNTSLQKLQDKDPQNPVHAVQRLRPGKYDRGQSEDVVVSALIDSLNDPNPEVRSAAVEVLNSKQLELGGRDSIAKTPALIFALKSQDPAVRITAAMILGAIARHEGLDGDGHRVADTANVSSIIPALIDTLDDRNADVRDMTVFALRGFDEEVMGPNAREKTSLLIPALKSPDPTVRSTAAWALGTIGFRAKLAVPDLIANLAGKSSYSCTRISAAWALGRFGSEAATAIPALVIALANEPSGMILRMGELDQDLQCSWPRTRSLNLVGLGISASPAMDAPRTRGGAMYLPRVRDFAADALVRIADASRDSQRTDAIALLRDASSGLEQNSLDSESKQVTTDVAVLESIRRGQWGDRLIDKIGAYPKTLTLTAVYVLLAIMCYGLLLKFPLQLLRFNESLAGLPKAKLPSWFGDMEISLPHLLLVGFFQYHPRVLDAWVERYLSNARDQFGRMNTVQQRVVHVDVSTEFDRKILPGLRPKDLTETFGRNRAFLLVWGEGGSGKTSMTYQIARWVMSDDPDDRPCEHRMLPVVIEHDLNLEVGGNRLVLTEMIRGQLANLTGENEAPSEEFTTHLLKQKRVLIIVDGLSELNEATRNKIRPLNPEFGANAWIVTSRLEEPLDGVTKSTLHPMRIKGNRLSSFMEAYLQKCGKRALFDDSEFFEGCKRLSSMVGERDITVLLAKLYAEHMISSKTGDADDSLPENIPDLMLEYVNRLNRRSTTMDNRAVQDAAKAIAWECLRQTFRPTPAAIDAVLESLGADAKVRLKYLEYDLRMVETIGVAHDRVRFALDPLAEYLAGIYVVEHYRADQNAWLEFLAKADLSVGAPESIRGFLLAVRDCSLANRTEFKVPGFVVGELARRGGLDPEAANKAHFKQRIERLVAALAVPEADERLAAADALTKMGPDAKPAMPSLIEALGDKNLYVRRSAAVALGSIGKNAALAIPFLIEALQDNEPTVQVFAAAGLCGIGYGDDRVVAALLEKIKGNDSVVRFGLRRMLAVFGSEVSDSLESATDILDRAAVTGHFDSNAEFPIRSLLKKISDQPAVYRVSAQNAAWAIGKEVHEFVDRARGSAPL
jgi:HEAT repeat protein